MDRKRNAIENVTFKKSLPKAYKRGRERILAEAPLPENMYGVYSSRFSPDGKILAIACGSGNIQVRHGETAELLETLRGGYEQALPVMSARFGPKEPHRSKKVKKRSSEKPKDVSIPKVRKSDAMTFSDTESDDDIQPTPTISKQEPTEETVKKSKPKDRPRGTFFAGSACGRIFKCLIDQGLCESFSKEEQNEVHAVDVDLTVSVLATGGKDNILRLYDIPTAKLIHSYDRSMEGEYRGHNSRVFSVRFDPSEKNTVISGGWDNVVKVWDIRTPLGVTHDLYGPHICGSDAIDIQGERLLTGSWSATDALKVWELRSMKVLQQVKPTNRPEKVPGEFLYAVHFFDGDGTHDLILAGGSGTGALEVISLQENMIVGKFNEKKAIVTIDSIGPVITYGGMNNKVTIAEFN